jgi:hypothetical protein
MSLQTHNHLKEEDAAGNHVVTLMTLLTSLRGWKPRLQIALDAMMHISHALLLDVSHGGAHPYS